MEALGTIAAAMEKGGFSRICCMNYGLRQDDGLRRALEPRQVRCCWCPDRANARHGCARCAAFEVVAMLHSQLTPDGGPSSGPGFAGRAGSSWERSFVFAWWIWA
jgi:hypothetical protein